MACNKENWSNNAEIKIFQEYLKIRTDHPDVDYGMFEYGVLFVLSSKRVIKTRVNIHFFVNIFYSSFANFISFQLHA